MYNVRLGHQSVVHKLIIIQAYSIQGGPKKK